MAISKKTIESSAFINQLTNDIELLERLINEKRTFIDITTIS